MLSQEWMRALSVTMFSLYTTPSFSFIYFFFSICLSWSQGFTLDSDGRRQWHPTPVLLPGKSHGWRSLVGCSPWGCWGSDMTERLHFYFSLSCIGEGNGNPLQCSCLENPRDGEAWWAAVYGVAQSRTWLKWLSSSSVCYIRIRCFYSWKNQDVDIDI